MTKLIFGDLVTICSWQMLTWQNVLKGNGTKKIFDADTNMLVKFKFNDLVTIHQIVKFTKFN